MINIKKFLNENADSHYADFNRKFIFSKYKILGVRIPILKKFAKDIEPEYIDLSDDMLYEEILLYGFSANNFKDEKEQLEYLINILPYIDNWATCDSIVCSLKSLTSDISYNFFTNLLKDEKEFYVRVGIVGLMRFFIKSNYIEEIVHNLENIKASQKYVKMAKAWFYAELCTSNFPLALKTISQTQDDFIRKTSISKAKQSYRITKEQKDLLNNI